MSNHVTRAHSSTMTVVFTADPDSTPYLTYVFCYPSSRHQQCIIFVFNIVSIYRTRLQPKFDWEYLRGMTAALAAAQNIDKFECIANS